MAQDEDRERRVHDRIARLRRRVDQLPDASPAVIAFLKGLLDLLADEL